MNFKETMEHLLAGGKIRNTAWNKHEFVYFKDSCLTDETGRIASVFSFDVTGSYEKYEDPKVTVWRRPYVARGRLTRELEYNVTSGVWAESKEAFEAYAKSFKDENLRFFGEWESMEVEL